MENFNKRRLTDLNNTLSKCKVCERLYSFRNEIATRKRKMYNKEIYWGKPVSGFGDLNAKILIIGLAPQPMEVIEQGGCLLEINLLTFYLNVLEKLDYQIKIILLIRMMVLS